MISQEERDTLISIRLRQAEECIADAELSMANERRAMAANRIYYGMFYAMLALGLLRGFKTSKHQQMIGWFNKNFVHTDIFPRNFSALVKKAFETRSDSDYQVNLVPTDDDLNALLVNMKLFISTVKTWLKEHPDG